mmetsp:Transcript_38684/g.98924  ORF Transcript_38684/g.98924 Transcript_38684/m.98924 type:complete len:268 (+) Transcript_38684:632-1435(+)
MPHHLFRRVGQGVALQQLSRLGVRNAIPDTIGGESKARAGVRNAHLLDVWVSEDVEAHVVVADGSPDAQATRPDAHGADTGVAADSRPMKGAGQRHHHVPSSLETVDFAVVVIQAVCGRELPHMLGSLHDDIRISNICHGRQPARHHQEARGAARHALSLNGLGIQSVECCCDRHPDLEQVRLEEFTLDLRGNGICGQPRHQLLQQVLLAVVRGRRPVVAIEHRIYAHLEIPVGSQMCCACHNAVLALEDFHLGRAAQCRRRRPGRE